MNTAYSYTLLKSTNQNPEPFTDTDTSLPYIQSNIEKNSENSMSKL